MDNIDVCPVCNGTSFDPFMVCTDFTTSHENFNLIKCSSCSFVITSPRPDPISLPTYYDSENYISHTARSSAFFDSLYLLFRRFTLRWKTNLIQQYKPKISILDYGCGTGEFLHACTAMGWEGFGIEPSHHAKSKAIALTKLNIKHSLSELEGRKFDVITLWHVLEHVPDLKQKLNELKGALNKNGMLFVAVPNHTAYDAVVYREYWAGFDVPRHLWHFSKITMQRLLTDAGLQLKEIRPMKLDAFYVSLLSQKYKSGSHTPYGMVRAILNGYLSNHKAKPDLNYSSLIYIAVP